MLRICGKFHRPQLLTSHLRQSIGSSKPVLDAAFKLCRPIVEPRWRCFHLCTRGQLFQNTKSRNWSTSRRMTSTKTSENLDKHSKKSDIIRLLSLAKGEKWYLIASIGCLVVSSAITMGVPYAIGRILDIIFTDAFSKEKLSNFCTILFGVFVIGGFANFGRVYLLNSASEYTRNISTTYYI